MLPDILSIGDKIHIRQLDLTGKPIRNAQPYVSQLLDFGDTDTIHISAPMINSQIHLLHPSSKYNLSFYTNKGLYQCSCEAIEKYKDNNIDVFKVRLTSNLEKIQRRQYYRLEMIHDIEYRLVSIEEQQALQQLQSETLDSTEKDSLKKQLNEWELDWVKTTITDLSGGGIRFNSRNDLKAGDQIKVKLEFVTGGKPKKLIIDSKIISVNKLLHASGVYECRVEFINIQQKDREDLIKYIFEQERLRRKKN